MPASGSPLRFDLSAFLFNAAGRSGRTAFLVGGLVTPFALGALGGWTASALPEGLLRSGGEGVVAFALLVLTGVATCRRLHDLGLSGWWFGLLWLYRMLATPLLEGEPSPVWWLVTPLVAAVLVLLLWPGQTRFNRFGPPQP